MGIASRTKWNHRIQHPTVRLPNGEKRMRVVDAAKVARRIALRHETRARVAIMAVLRLERMARAEKAAAKHQGHIIRRRKAARLNGWRPHAQR